MQQSSEAVLTQARAALAHVPYQGHHLHPTIHLRLSDGALILEGEVADIVDKTRAAAHLRRVDGVTMVIDHLRIADGAAPVGDGELRDAVRQRLLTAIDFRNCKICAKVKGQDEARREAVGERSGWIEVAAANGVVTLSGTCDQPLPHAAGWRAGVVVARLLLRGERTGGGAGRGR